MCMVGTPEADDGATRMAAHSMIGDDMMSLAAALLSRWVTLHWCLAYSPCIHLITFHHSFLGSGKMS